MKNRFFAVHANEENTRFIVEWWDGEYMAAPMIRPDFPTMFTFYVEKGRCRPRQREYGRNGMLKIARKYGKSALMTRHCMFPRLPLKSTIPV